MNKEGKTGMATVILLGGIILLAGAATSGLIGTTDVGLEEYEQMLNDIINEISHYIEIKDIVGKYYIAEGEQYIQKIAILFKPLFTFDLDTTDSIIKIDNGEHIRILTYSGQTEYIFSNSLFGHDLWNNFSESNFSFIVIRDKDRSLVDYNSINDNTDMAYIIIKLPKELFMKKGETLQVSLFPSGGIDRTFTIKAPLPMKSVVTFS